MLKDVSVSVVRVGKAARGLKTEKKAGKSE